MVQILDSTLREGEQTPGVYFDNHIKLAIAEILDKIGVDYIEAGHPAVSQRIEQAVKQVARANFNAKIAAHSRSMRKDVDQALSCGVDFIGIFYCVSNDRLNGVFKKDIKSASKHIAGVIRYAKEKNPDVIIRYTPEDTVRSNFQNVLEASKAAAEAGADIISIADTTGHMIPGTNRSMFSYISKLKNEFNNMGLTPKLAVHCHNDRGLALANTLDAYRAGVDIIDASTLGIGERVGIVDLAQLLTVLSSDFEEGEHWNMEHLPELYGIVSAHSNIPIPVNYPVIGKNAFTHCAGVHTHAAKMNPVHYQSLDPAIVGRRTEICLDHMSGFSSVEYALKVTGLESTPEETLDVLNEVKRIGRKGKTVEEEELRYIVKMVKEHGVPDSKEE